eukprot:1743404-Lingulodinium_polyedra.AAC.1
MSSWLTQTVPMLGPMCLLPSALNDFHDVFKVSLMGLSPGIPGTKHITTSSIRWSCGLSRRN